MIFTEEKQQKLEKIRIHAENHRVDADTLAAMERGEKKAAGHPEDNYTYTCGSLMIVFSIEEQPKPVSWTRHLSVSFNTQGINDEEDLEFILSCRLNTEMMFKEMIKIFGFQETNPRKLQTKIIKEENYPLTLHLLEPVAKTWKELLD